MNQHVSRRDLLRFTGLAGFTALAAACSAPAAPSPTAAPAPKPTTPPAAAAPAATPAPAQQAPAAAKPASAQPADWTQVVDAGKKEGHLLVASYPGTGYRKVMDDFEAAYPGIKVEQTGFQTSAKDFLPRYFKERDAGLYAWDILMMPSTEFFIQAIPRNAIDPVRPLLVLPEVLDDKGWRDGFESGWLDKDKKYTYGYTRARSQSLYYNTDLVKEGEITGFKDLLDPRWRGKITGGDPRTKGSGYWSATAMRAKMGGDDIVKRFYKDQDVQLGTDARQLTESVVRGKYPVGVGAISAPIMVDFLAQGIGKNVKNIPSLEVDVVQSSNNVLMYANRAPNPNAAKLFANWILTKEGGASISKNVQDNSRRADVPVFEPSVVPEPGVDYLKIDAESYVEEILKTQKIANEVLG